MKLQIDCYSQEEYSVQIDYSGKLPFEEDEKSELFLFACYTLRQMKNLGDHLVSDLLAGIFTQSPENLLKESPELMPGAAILSAHKQIELEAKGLDEKTLWHEVGQTMARLQLDPKIGIIDEDFLPTIANVKFVDYKGDAKKQFIITMPPFQFHVNGFGVLGDDVNYYALASTFLLFRFFANKHKNNPAYINRLTRVANACAIAQITKQISPDQPNMANYFIFKVFED